MIRRVRSFISQAPGPFKCSNYVRLRVVEKNTELYYNLTMKDKEELPTQRKRYGHCIDANDADRLERRENDM